MSLCRKTKVTSFDQTRSEGDKHVGHGKEYKKCLHREPDGLIFLEVSNELIFTPMNLMILDLIFKFEFISNYWPVLTFSKKLVSIWPYWANGHIYFWVYRFVKLIRSTIYYRTMSYRIISKSNSDQWQNCATKKITLNLGEAIRKIV